MNAKREATRGEKKRENQYFTKRVTHALRKL